ncbi:MAG TPA: N(4)-(beta-N-acetylglucosaminyl)-L-asparaginase [Verrucomicrobiae bacterium]
MKKKLSRRKFVAAAGLGAFASGSFGALGQSPQVITGSRVAPLVISSANGNHSKDPEGRTAVTRAFKMITDGADVLDAVIAGVNIVELDPEDTSVGYGGLPNAEGIVQLDSSVMHGPLKRAGAVACIEGVRTPSLVARKVMDETDNHLIVGKGAQAFARNMGFKIEDDLNTEKSRRIWMEWKRRTDPEHYPDPKTRKQAQIRERNKMVAEGLIDRDHVFGTINCNGINAKGEVCGVTTTSGLAFKIPGRVGDSPILGAGLYVDGEVGAAGSTGRGEANLFSLASFLIVEQLRNGTAPKDAGMLALKRIASNTIEKRLLNSRGAPNFNVTFYVLNIKGEHAAVSLYGTTYALCDANGPQELPVEALYPGKPED